TGDAERGRDARPLLRQALADRVGESGGSRRLDGRSVLLAVVLALAAGQWLADLAVVAVDRERLEAELPALEVDVRDVLDGRRLRHVDRLADGARDEGLHRGHHPDVAHRGDGPLTHGAVEHLVVLRPQAR